MKKKHFLRRHLEKNCNKGVSGVEYPHAKSFIRLKGRVKRQSMDEIMKSKTLSGQTNAKIHSLDNSQKGRQGSKPDIKKQKDKS